MHTKTPLCHSTELVECIAITLIKYIHARPLHTIGLANELYNFNQFVKIGLLLSELHVQDAWYSCMDMDTHQSKKAIRVFMRVWIGISNQCFQILVNQNKQCILPFFWFNGHYLDLPFAFDVNAVGCCRIVIILWNQPFWHYLIMNWSVNRMNIRVNVKHIFVFNAFWWWRSSRNSGISARRDWILLPPFH